MSEPVIILDPGEERAQQIARALSSRTAGKILENLSGGPRSLSDIAEDLQIPLTKIKYHITNLLEAGILEITEERYSVKGRRIKIYGLKPQVLVVAPKMVNLRALLLQYSSVFGIFLSITLVLAGIRSYYLSSLQPRLLGGGSLESAPPIPTMSGPLQNLLTDSSFILLFFIGGCIVVACLIIRELLIGWSDSKI
jgi:DNA-binding transcriptional ArsR family regulator